jgi:hypothetical protein
MSSLQATCETTDLWSVLTISLLTTEDVDFMMLIISVKFCGYLIYHQNQRSQILRFAHRVYVCVFLMDLQNKQWLLRSAALTDLFL